MICFIRISEGAYDLIIGSELAYYRTDLDSLVKTVTQLAGFYQFIIFFIFYFFISLFNLSVYFFIYLLGPNSVFVHAHIFRVDGMVTFISFTS